MNFFDIHKIPNKGIPLSVQRKLWLRNFMQAFFVVFFVYMAMYLIRNNFKAAQPFLKRGNWIIYIRTWLYRISI